MSQFYMDHTAYCYELKSERKDIVLSVLKKNLSSKGDNFAFGSNNLNLKGRATTNR